MPSFQTTRRHIQVDGCTYTSHLSVGPISALAHSCTLLTASPNLKDSKISSVWDRTTTVSHRCNYNAQTWNYRFFSWNLLTVATTLCPSVICCLFWVPLCVVSVREMYLQFPFRSCENRTSVQYARSHLAASHVHSSVRKPTLHNDLTSLVVC